MRSGRRAAGLVGIGTAVAVLAACAGPVGPPPAPAPVPTAEPAPASESPPADPGGYPTPDTTGATAGTTRTTFAGDIQLDEPGEVLSGAQVNGDVRVLADDVVIRDSVVLGRITNQDGAGHWRFTVEDTTVGDPARCSSTGEGAIGIDAYTARRVRIEGFSDGFRVSGNDVVIEDSFVKLCDNPGAHADGIQGYGGGTGVRIIHNTIDARVGESENAAVFFADGSLSAEVRDNLLIGGGWTLRLHDQTATKEPQDAATYIVTGNRIAAGTSGYGPTSVDDCDRRRAIEWSDNQVVQMSEDYGVTEAGTPLAC